MTDTKTKIDTIKITRRTILGWGWTTNCTTDGCEMPGVDYTGTIRQLQDQISDDKTYRSCRNGTYHRTQYFLRGVPIKMTNDFEYFLAGLDKVAEIKLDDDSE